MDRYAVYSYDLDRKFNPDTTYLFNSSTHLELQSKKGWTVFELFDHEKKCVAARISVCVQAGIAKSPMKAPFGSLEVYARVSTSYLKIFLAVVEVILQQEKVTSLEIRSYPEQYNIKQAHTIKKIVTELGFTTSSEISSAIIVDKKSFVSKIAMAKKQRLKKSQGVFHFKQVGLDELNQTYRFISRCRKEKGYTLSMTLAALKKTVSVFKAKFFFFQLVNGTEIVAAAIVIQVSDSILYTFYYSHAQKYDKLSPVVFLLSGIYEFAQKNKMKLIDLGTSMTEHGINKKLLHFKESVGGVSNKKFTFTKTYA